MFFPTKFETNILVLSTSSSSPFRLTTPNIIVEGTAGFMGERFIFALSVGQAPRSLSWPSSRSLSWPSFPLSQLAKLPLSQLAKLPALSVGQAPRSLSWPSFPLSQLAKLPALGCAGREFAGMKSNNKTITNERENDDDAKRPKVGYSGTRNTEATSPRSLDAQTLNKLKTFSTGNDDSSIAGKVLNICTTMYNNFLTAVIPTMRLHVHLRRLVEEGHKVGVVNQVESSLTRSTSENKNIVFNRQLVGVYSKATLIGDDILSEVLVNETCTTRTQ
uniref:DNA mismatch repair protein MutS-like N-terminal domain-containing protein n=1 Tax=Timema cristinae TaxID=61476 RepID=A0A7R9H2Q5_TIMCR|nr:unnamed protein product [Timema cristinae]